MGEEQGLSAELKPCPFCGGTAEIERFGTPRQSTIYACTDCDCRLETGEEWGFGARWNTRAEGLQPPVEGGEEDLSSVGSGLTPLVPSPSAAGLIAQPSGHTPGPWSICGEDRGGCRCNTIMAADHPIGKYERGEWGDRYPSVRLVGSSLDRTAEAYMEFMAYGEVPEAEAVANGRLMAAAPDLLGALKAAEYAMGNIVRPDSCAGQEDTVCWAESYFLPLARAALAKASPERCATTTTADGEASNSGEADGVRPNPNLQTALLQGEPD